MVDVSFPVTEALAVALNMSRERLAAELRMAAAVKLYELGRLSTGAAAELAGVPVPQFLSRLSDFGVSALRSCQADIEQDFARA